MSRELAERTAEMYIGELQDLVSYAGFDQRTALYIFTRGVEFGMHEGVAGIILEDDDETTRADPDAGLKAGSGGSDETGPEDDVRKKEDTFLGTNQHFALIPGGRA